MVDKPTPPLSGLIYFGVLSIGLQNTVRPHGRRCLTSRRVLLGTFGQPLTKVVTCIRKARHPGRVVFERHKLHSNNFGMDSLSKDLQYLLLDRATNGVPTFFFVPPVRMHKGAEVQCSRRGERHWSGNTEPFLPSRQYHQRLRQFAHFYPRPWRVVHEVEKFITGFVGAGCSQREEEKGRG